MHSVTDVNKIGHVAFHTLADKMKAEGRIKHVGISSHGPRGEEGDSMETVLCAAAEDGRFDLMLLVYNFLNFEEGEKVLAACKKHNIGTTAMKTNPGRLEIHPLDEDNLYEGYADYIERATGEGLSREEALERIRSWIAEQEAKVDEIRPFVDKHGLTTNEELRAASLQWVLRNKNMHTACMGLSDFEGLDRYLPLSGTKLSANGASFLEQYARAYGHQYCRHACTACAGSCPHKLPVSTIMRYSYYFSMQKREKHAMGKYAKLGGQNGARCRDCAAPCLGTCPHGVDVRRSLLAAHDMLSLT